VRVLVLQIWHISITMSNLSGGKLCRDLYLHPHYTAANYGVFDVRWWTLHKLRRKSQISL